MWITTSLILKPNKTRSIQQHKNSCDCVRVEKYDQIIFRQKNKTRYYRGGAWGAVENGKSFNVYP